MHSITLEIFTEIWLPHNGLLASKLGKKASTILGAIHDAGLEASSKELEEASKEFWRKEDGKRAAMVSFRDALTEITADKKLVIVVDELDRCRPDYALNLLEVIKHFFDVPNVHFVLGVNLKELANSVRARYGANIEAEKYLQKFVSISMPLIPKPSRNSSSQVQLRHFNAVSTQIGLKDEWKHAWLEEYIGVIGHHAKLSLRDVERIASLAVVTPSPNENKREAVPHLYIGALVLHVLAPQALEKARLGEMKEADFFAVFNLYEKQSAAAYIDQMHNVWRLVTHDRVSSLPAYLAEKQKDLFGDVKPRDLLKTVIADTLDVFEVLV